MKAEIRLEIRVFGGLDQLSRVINITRRGKVFYRNIEARFENGEVRAAIDMEGKAEEIEWLIKKMTALPEVISIETRAKTVELEDPLTEIFLP